MGYKGRTASLSIEQAQRLLSCVVDAEVLQTQKAAFTNDVFRVSTRSHGNYYVKFHTARWYLDMEDTADVVDRELAGYELLRKRGIELPYQMWGDCTRSVVPQSVVISQELVGEPVTAILRRQPECADAIAEALGRYLSRIHGIEFANRTPLSRLHVLVATPVGCIPYANPGKNMPWNWEKEDPCAKAQESALAELAQADRLGLLSSESHRELERLFKGISEANKPMLRSPRFTLLNCHACHFHAQETRGQWEITGVYDFEAVAADNPTGDLVEVEIGLTTAMRGFAWRSALAKGYGRLPDFRRYKMGLLRSILYHTVEQTRSGRFREIVPDIQWLSARWAGLAQANRWDELTWYPAT